MGWRTPMLLCAQAARAANSACQCSSSQLLTGDRRLQVPRRFKQTVLVTSCPGGSPSSPAFVIRSCLASFVSHRDWVHLEKSMWGNFKGQLPKVRSLLSFESWANVNANHVGSPGQCVYVHEFRRKVTYFWTSAHQLFKSGSSVAKKEWVSNFSCLLYSVKQLCSRVVEDGATVPLGREMSLCMTVLRVPVQGVNSCNPPGLEGINCTEGVFVLPLLSQVL